MRARITYFILFFASVIILIALFLIPNPFLYTRQSAFRLSVPAYSGASPDFHETRRIVAGKLKHLWVTFDFRTPPSAGFENLFQTGPMNRGVRFEISKFGTAAVIIGAANAAGFVPYIVSSQVSPNAWHTFSLSIDPENNVDISLDGTQAIHEMNPTLDYDVSDLAVGTAFARSRTFRGNMKNVVIAYDTYNPNPMASTYLNAAKVFFFVMGLIMLFMLGAPNATEVALARNQPN